MIPGERGRRALASERIFFFSLVFGNTLAWLRTAEVRSDNGKMSLAQGQIGQKTKWGSGSGLGTIHEAIHLTTISQLPKKSEASILRIIVCFNMKRRQGTSASIVNRLEFRVYSASIHDVVVAAEQRGTVNMSSGGCAGDGLASPWSPIKTSWPAGGVLPLWLVEVLGTQETVHCTWRQVNVGRAETAPRLNATVVPDR